MDPAWGVVFVSFFSVAGAVAAAWITAHFTKKAGDIARDDERLSNQREQLASRAEAFFAQIGVLDDLAGEGSRGNVGDTYFDDVDKEQRKLRLVEYPFAVVAPVEVAKAARALVDAYTNGGWQPGDTRGLKDELVDKLRVTTDASKLSLQIERPDMPGRSWRTRLAARLTAGSAR